MLNRNTRLPPTGKEVVVLTSRMVLQDSEASREVFVTIAPGQLSLDALGSMAYASSAADPRFVAKTISMRSTTIDLAMLVERVASSSGASSDPSMHGNSSSTRLTKLAFTVGPACEDPAVMEEFVRAGANLARFNVSHGSLEKHTAMLGQLRGISSKHGARVAVMLELAGPQVRTSYLVKSRESKERVSKVEVKAGDDVELFGTDDTNPATFTGYKTDNKVRLVCIVSGIIILCGVNHVLHVVAVSAGLGSNALSPMALPMLFIDPTCMKSAATGLLLYGKPPSF